MHRPRIWLIGFVMLGLAQVADAQGLPDSLLADEFGFLPLEIYKLDSRTNNLQSGDLDGDGIDDIIVVNNSRSRIDLLLSTKGPSDWPQRPGANQVRTDQRMRLRSIPVNKEVISLQVGDFNGDRQLDLAYYGTPAELIVLINRGEARFEESRRFQTGEAVESGSALAVGDLNRDGLLDLGLVTPNEIITIMQTQAGGLQEPDRTPHAGSGPRLLKFQDLDGDGGDDLILLDSNREAPLRVRFSTPEARLGAEERFMIESPRAMSFLEFNGKPGREIATIDAQSGRVRILGYNPEPAGSNLKPGRLLIFPFPKGDSRGRVVDLGDLNGDGKLDLVASDPGGAQLIAYVQGSSGLQTGRMSACVAGTRSLSVADLGDQRAEVYVLSPQEKQIAIAKWENDRLGIPTPLLSTGEPQTLEVNDLDGDLRPELIYVTRREGTSEEFELRALQRAESNNWKPLKWEDGSESIAFTGISGKAMAVRVIDVNRDKKPDVLISGEYGAPVLLMGRGGRQAPAVFPGGTGPLSSVPANGLTRGIPEDPAALIVAQNTFIRRIELDPAGQWRVMDQVNLGRAAAQAAAAVMIDVDGDGRQDLVVYDKTSRSLVVIDRKDGVDRPVGTWPLGSFEFNGMRTGDLDGDNREDLLIAGMDRFGVLLAGRISPRFETLATYETGRSDAHLADLIAADFNGDAHVDVAVIDTSEHMVELLTVLKPGRLERALTFKVFDKKSFRESDSLVEPRDLTIGDFDGDQRTDLALLVHDRVLIYRQDTGSMPQTAGTAARDVARPERSGVSDEPTK